MFMAKLLGRHDVADGTMAFEFEKPAGWTFDAGQFIDMTLLNPEETDAEGNTRGFSIASAPFEDEADGRDANAQHRLQTGVEDTSAGQRSQDRRPVRGSPFTQQCGAACGYRFRRNWNHALPQHPHAGCEREAATPHRCSSTRIEGRRMPYSWKTCALYARERNVHVCSHNDGDGQVASLLGRRTWSNRPTDVGEVLDWNHFGDLLRHRTAGNGEGPADGPQGYVASIVTTSEPRSSQVTDLIRSLHWWRFGARSQGCRRVMKQHTPASADGSCNSNVQSARIYPVRPEHGEADRRRQYKCH